MDFTGKPIYGAAVRCEDEVAGMVRDVLFDTHDWSVRYLVIAWI
jgi:hypothetical protein